MSTATSTDDDWSNDRICFCTEKVEEDEEEADGVVGYCTTLAVTEATSALGRTLRPRRVHLGNSPAVIIGGELTGTISTAITLDILCSEFAVLMIFNDIKSECCNTSHKPEA